MPIALAQTPVTYSLASSSLSMVVYGSNNTAGNCLILLAENYGGNSTFVSDTQGNKWVRVPGARATSGLFAGEIWYAPNCKGGPNTVRIASTGSNANNGTLYEFSGLSKLAPLDQSSSATGVGSNPSSGSVTTNFANELVIAYFTSTTVGTPPVNHGAGYTQDYLLSNTLMNEHKIVSSIGTYQGDGTYGGSETWIAGVATFSDTQVIQQNVICQGDSITSGTGVVTPWTSSLSLTLSSAVTNLGVVGAQMATMLTSAQSIVDTLFIPGIKNVCVIWGGTNDFAVAGASVATVESYLSEYIAARHAIGWQVVSVEMLDRGDVNVDTQKNAYNAFMLGLPNSLDAAVTISPLLVADGASSNATYFQADKIHPTQLSDTTLIAPEISAVINALPNGVWTSTQLVSDNFVRGSYPENPLGKVGFSDTGNWSAITGGGGGSLQSVSPGLAEAAATGTDSEMFWSGGAGLLSSWPNDQYAEATVNNSPSGSNYFGAGVRLTATTGYVGLGVAAGTTWAVEKISGSSYVVLGSPFSVPAVAQGDVIRLVVQGNAITLLKNGMVYQTVLDSSNTSGSPGIYVNGATLAGAQYSLWTAGALTLSSISGNAGAANATISYGGPSSGSVIADGSGNYSISGLLNGTYTVTPSKTGYIFSPMSVSETVSGANITGVNFTATKESGGYDFRFRF